MSKLIMFEFECPTHGIFEDLIQPTERSTPCPQCGLNAPRQISAPRIDHLAMATSASASPESIRKFDRAHRQRTKKENKADTDHGDYGKAAGAD